MLGCPPRLICINRGGHFKGAHSINQFCEAVFVTASVKTEAVEIPARLGG
jgi:hypothetical protein